MYLEVCKIPDRGIGISHQRERVTKLSTKEFLDDNNLDGEPDRPDNRPISKVINASKGAYQRGKSREDFCITHESVS